MPQVIGALRLRQYLATMLLHSQVDLFSLQTLLGHWSIESTAIYLHADLSELSAAVGSRSTAWAKDS